MTVYIILFFLGFILAVCLLAYTSIQVAALAKRTEEFGKNIKEHYSKPLTDLEEAEKKNAEAKDTGAAEAKAEVKDKKDEKKDEITEEI